jgi:two-component system, OmpR family, sensor histidine kinase MprB
MSLRSRFALAFALVAAVVAGLVGLLSYHAAADRIQSETDRSLQTATTALLAGNDDALSTPVPNGRDGRFAAERRMAAQTIAPNGTTSFVGGRPVQLPVTDADRALAASGRGGAVAVEEVDVGPDRFRVMTTALGNGRGALQVAVDVDDVRRVLGGMAIQITWVSAAVLLVAAGAGWLLARRITRRLEHLASIAERVNEDGRPPEPVPVEGRDEVGRLAGAFDTMLLRLATAREAQERLVQDVAHELRTPLTSLRTNASVLRRFAELPADAQARLVDDVQGESRELSHLVDELVESALARRGDEPEQPVDLATVVSDAADRARRLTGRAIDVHLAGETVVLGRERDLARAVGNLLENAAKFDAESGAPVVVSLRGEAVTVADRGPGIPHDELARVFDRFHRADAARGQPGSGLGLSIVRDVARAHGGDAFARNREGGGAVVGFTVDPGRLLPGSEQGHVEASPAAHRVEGT